MLERFRKKPVKILDYSHVGSIRVGFCDKNLFNKFLHVDFPIGKKGVSLSISKKFLKSNILLKYVVQGIFATDGSLVLTKNPNKYYPRVEFTSISRELMNQVNNYLSSLGINGKVYHKKILRKRNFNENDFYRIQLKGMRNLLLFKNKIGFVNPKHIQRFKLFLTYSRNYDKAIKGIPNRKQKFFRVNNLNAAGGNCTPDLRLSHK